MIHRTFKMLEPGGEVEVVERPEGKVKLVFFTGAGADQKEIFGAVIDRQDAFHLAMEILQHLHRLGGRIKSLQDSVPGGQEAGGSFYGK